MGTARSLGLYRPAMAVDMVSFEDHRATNPPNRLIEGANVVTGYSLERRIQLAALAGVDTDAQAGYFAQDGISRARWAQAHNNGRCFPTGRIVPGPVALVLDDTVHLIAMKCTPEEAARRVADSMLYPPADINAWLVELRARLDTDVTPGAGR